MKISERERKLSIITLGVVFFYLFYQFLLVPRWAEIGKLETQVGKARLELKIVEGKLKILESIEKKMPEMAEDPGKEWKLRALCTLLGAISKSRMDLSSIKPEVAEEGKGLIVDLSCSGGYNNLYRFIKILRDLKMLVIIDSLNVTGGGSKKPVLSMKMGVTISY